MGHIRMLEDRVAPKLVARPSGSAADPVSVPWRVLRYNVQTTATAMVAASAAAICALLGWPVWAMFLGWVTALTTGRSLREISCSYLCFVGGIGIGTAGALAVGHLNPIMGPLASGAAVLGMATVIVSMRKVPYMNVVSSYILGVLGIFALHPGFIVIGASKVAAPAAVGATGVWLATRLQSAISNIPNRAA